MDLFDILEIQLSEDPYLRQPMDEDLLLRKGDVRFFDREGYQLTNIEVDFHHANSVGTVEEPRMSLKALGADLTSVYQNWYVQTRPHPSIHLDHSFLLMRYAYAGEARTQLEHLSKQQPALKKLLAIRPKYGIDFCVDYIGGDHFIEILHIEHDARNLEEMTVLADHMMERLRDIDWEDAAGTMLQKTDEWFDLEAYKQADYKARFFGIDMGFYDLKTF